MKLTILFLVIFLALSALAIYSQQLPADSSKRDYNFSVSMLSALTMDDFKTNYGKDYLFGFNFDANLGLFRRIKGWKTGAQFEILIDGKTKDEIYGIELQTQSVFIRLNLVNRLQPARYMKLKPFIEFEYGINVNTTSSTYEIVNKASFFEKFFLNAEDVALSETMKQHADINQNFEIGMGILIKDIWTMSIRYNYVPEISLVRKDGAFVKDNKLDYKLINSEIRMLIIGLGISPGKKYTTHSKIAKTGK